MFKVSAGTFIPHPHPCLNMVKVLGNLPKEEKHQKSDSRKKRNKDGWGWRRLKRIGNDDFEKFRLIFSKKFLKNWKERRQSPFNSWRYHVFARTLTWYFIGVYIINWFSFRDFLNKHALIQAVKAIAVSPPPVKMVAHTVMCAMREKEDSIAHVFQASRDTDVNSQSDHVKTLR